MGQKLIPKITSWKLRGARAPVPHSWRRQWLAESAIAESLIRYSHSASFQALVCISIQKPILYKVGVRMKEVSENCWLLIDNDRSTVPWGMISGSNAPSQLVAQTQSSSVRCLRLWENSARRNSGVIEARRRSVGLGGGGGHREARGTCSHGEVSTSGTRLRLIPSRQPPIRPAHPPFPTIRPALQLPDY